MKFVFFFLFLLICVVAALQPTEVTVVGVTFYGDNCHDIDPPLWKALAAGHHIPELTNQMGDFFRAIEEADAINPCSPDFSIHDPLTGLVHPRAKLVNSVLRARALERTDHMAVGKTGCLQRPCAARVTFYKAKIDTVIFSMADQETALILGANLGKNGTIPSILWDIYHRHNTNQETCHPFHRMKRLYCPFSGNTFELPKHGKYHSTLMINAPTWYPREAEVTERKQEDTSYEYYTSNDYGHPPCHSFGQC